MWKIPLFDVILGENESEAVEKVLRSGWLTMGSVTKEFEQHFAKFLGVRHALAVSSGTAALHLANLALGGNHIPPFRPQVPSRAFKIATARARCVSLQYQE